MYLYTIPNLAVAYNPFPFYQTKKKILLLQYKLICNNSSRGWFVATVAQECLLEPA